MPRRPRATGRTLRTFCAALLWPVAASAGTSDHRPADLVYRHGFVYTVDAHDSVQQAVAVRDGRIAFVGTDAGVAAYVGRSTRVVDLEGRMLMPGLVDGHLHPLEGGASLGKCNLGYARLRMPELQAAIQACLDRTVGQEPSDWLEVVSWFQEGMFPADVVTTRAALDALRTQRPILVVSSFGHTVLANSRALSMAGITAATPDPVGGKIGRDASGAPTGILDDAAQDLVTRQLPPPTAADDVKSATLALAALARQGVTTFLDARADDHALAAFARLQREGQLTARAHFALLITPPEGRDAVLAVRHVSALAQRYDGGALQPRATLSVRNVKLFLDGVISAPAQSGAMLQPYLVPPPTGSGAWVAGTNRGPEVYFPSAVLQPLLIAVVSAGLEPHLHADGDRAVREALDGAAAVRAAFPSGDVRVAIAHDESVDPADFGRFASAPAIPVLSFQWEKRAPDTVDNAERHLGPERFGRLEPAGVLAAAGARIAFGSDWPVDPLDEWFAVQVAVTRTNRTDQGPQYAGRLGADPGLTRRQVLHAMTIDAAYELHDEHLVGSIETGKFADLIVLDRNVVSVAAEEIAGTTVLQTVVGGRIVHESGALRSTSPRAVPRGAATP